MNIIEELTAEVVRYRLAWRSAARRARAWKRTVQRLRGQLAEAYATAARMGQQLDRAVAELGAARAEVARLDARLVRTQRDDARVALERVAVERAYERTCAALQRHRAAAQRFRLAWTSARQRADNHLAALVHADDERDALRGEVVALGKEGEGLRQTLVSVLSKVIDFEVDDAATARLRAALDEERIDPEACENAWFPEHGRRSPCALCGYPADVARRTEGEAG